MGSDVGQQRAYIRIIDLVCVGMWERIFLHELTAYLTWAKVGEKIFYPRVKSQISISGVQEHAILDLRNSFNVFVAGNVAKVLIFLVSKHRKSSFLLKLITFCSSLYTLHEKIFTVVLKHIFKFSFLVKSSSVYLSNMAACYRSRGNAMSCAKRAVLLLWITCVIYVLWFSCFRVCSLLPCGHLLGKAWCLGYCLWCLIVFLSSSHLVSLVRYSTWLIRFLIFAAFLTFIRMQ